MTRLGFLSVAMLGLASVMAPAPVAAQDAAGVTGAAEAAFPNGATFNGVPLKGLTLGQGMFIAPDGSAGGPVQAGLHGPPPPRPPPNVPPDGEGARGGASARRRA